MSERIGLCVDQLYFQTKNLTQIYGLHSHIRLVHVGIILVFLSSRDNLCDLMVRVPGYRSRDPGFDSRRYQIFWKLLGPELGPISLVRITEELLEWKNIAVPGLENR
jgi:hypothetical protein